MVDNIMFREEKMVKLNNIKSIAMIIFLFLMVSSISSGNAFHPFSKSIIQNVENDDFDRFSLELLNYTFNFNKPDMKKTSIYDDVFYSINLPGCYHVGRIGEPVLPVKSVRISLPPCTDISEVVVESKLVKIDTEVKEKIWYPFFTTKEKGTGMGLAIIRKIVNTLKGEISLKETGPGGTIFKIIFYS